MRTSLMPTCSHSCSVVSTLQHKEAKQFDICGVLGLETSQTPLHIRALRGPTSVLVLAGGGGNKMLSKYKLWIGAAIGLMVGGLIIGAIRPKQVSGAKPGASPVVEVVKVEQKDVPIYAELIG